MKGIFVILISACCISMAIGSCGVPAVTPDVSLTGDRIVGGTVAVPHSWPWQAALYSKAIGGLVCEQICGGTLISEEWVVSAAHCVYGDENAPGGFSLKLGAQKKGYGCWANPFEYKAQQVSAVSEIHIHPNYNHEENTWDISLLKLSKPVKFTQSVSPVCLPGASDTVADGENVVVTGWGTTSDGGLSTAQALHEVVVPIVGNSQCDLDYSGTGNGTVVSKTMICAGFKDGGKDSCQGDSGGPLVAFHNGSWVLEGIVSWGEGCAQPGYPGVYGRVSEFTDFIASTTGVKI